jgi:hypothetical protein
VVVGVVGVVVLVDVEVVVLVVVLVGVVLVVGVVVVVVGVVVVVEMEVVVVGGGGLDAPLTTGVGFDVLTAEPFLLLAVTTSRKVKPTSAAAWLYDWSVAPVIALQSVPMVEQRTHW